MTADGEIYDFDLRHALQISECRKMLRAIQRVQKQNLQYCILGKYVTESKLDPRPAGINAVFYQLKSPLGYVIDMDF